MTRTADMAALSPRIRAELIYRSAKQSGEADLWRAALGQTEPAAAQPAHVAPPMDVVSMWRAIAEPSLPSLADPQRVESGSGTLSLGPNGRHAASLERAARRTGLPAAALAAIVGAEAAKDNAGRWIADSRNPRSSATGLGQFLSATWLGEAERAGTNLHRIAGERGWLDGAGRVRAGAREALLALRTDPTVSIEAIADFARANLRRLEAGGVRVGGSVDEVARAAYLAHHLGAGDARRFMGGGLTAERAERLLAMQVGGGAAAQRIAAAGDPVLAHRQWLLGYVGRHVQPASFIA